MNEINRNKKSIIIEFILANAFILNLAAGMISNYSAKIFLLKGFISAVLIFVVFIDFRSQKIEVRSKMFTAGLSKILLVLFLFLSYLALTLTYSSNQAYGFQKILNFLSSTVPSVIAFYYLIVTVSKERFKIFIIALVTITLVTVTYILIDYPFDPGTIYEYRAGRWSHVIYGRIIGSIAVVFLFCLMWMIEKSKTKEERRKVISLIFITSLAVYGLYLSSLRSAMIGVVLCVVLGVLWLVYRMVVNRETLDVRRKPATPGKQLVGIVTVVILTISFMILIPKPEIIDIRFDNLTQIEDMKFGGDEPINTRIEALKISKELFFVHPVFGVGFGGFRSYNNFSEIVKYPHNIFLEMAVEGGVVGLLVLWVLLFILFKYTYRYSRLAFIFLLFSFFLTMFSKELSNQGSLWIFLAFVGIKLQSLSAIAPEKVDSGFVVMSY